MKKISCNVVKDLLPSYLEGICSEDTVKLVKEHLEECRECGAFIKMMQETELVSEKSERKAVDSVKRVKKYIQKIMGFAVLLGLFGIGAAMFSEYYGAVPIGFYLTAMPIFLLVFYWIFFEEFHCQKWGKWAIGFCIAETMLVGYSILLEFLSVEWIQRGQYPFGLEAGEVGRFLSVQYGIGVVIQGMLLAVVIWADRKKRGFCRIGVVLGILGITVNLSFLSLLRRMDTLEGFLQVRNQTLFWILAEWGLLTAGLELVVWIRRRNKKSF